MSIWRSGTRPRSIPADAAQPVDPVLLRWRRAAPPRRSPAPASRRSAVLVGASARSRLSRSSSAAASVVSARAASSREIACWAAIQRSEPSAGTAGRRPLGWAVSGIERAHSVPRLARPAPRSGPEARHRRRRRRAHAPAPRSAASRSVALRERRKGPAGHAAGERAGKEERKGKTGPHARSLGAKAGVGQRGLRGFAPAPMSQPPARP